MANSPLHIILVEDDVLVATVIEGQLKAAGHKIRKLAHDGREALDAAKEPYVDLIITDLMMPNMSGIELCSQVRESNPFIPIIALTANDSAANMKEAFDAGFSGFYAKPIADFDDFLQVMTRKANDYRKIRNSHQQLQLSQMFIEQMSEVMHRDSLTGALTRKGLLQKLKVNSFSETASSDSIVVMFDLDDFKQVNDLYGHNTGDTVIKLFFDYIQYIFGQDGLICRWGGEEFILIIKTQYHHFIETELQRFLEGLAIVVTPKSVGQVSASIGYATNSEAVECSELTWRELIEQADQALYYIKSHGKNNYISYAALAADGI